MGSMSSISVKILKVREETVYLKNNLAERTFLARILTLFLSEHSLILRENIFPWHFKK